LLPWELRFRQSSFHHIPRVLQGSALHVFRCSLLSEHALVPLSFRRPVSSVTQGPPYESFPPAVGISSSSSATRTASSSDMARPAVHAAANAASPRVARRRRGRFWSPWAGAVPGWQDRRDPGDSDGAARSPFRRRGARSDPRRDGARARSWRGDPDATASQSRELSPRMGRLDRSRRLDSFPSG
jgi:hypothetical protein